MLGISVYLRLAALGLRELPGKISASSHVCIFAKCFWSPCSWFHGFRTNNAHVRLNSLDCLLLLIIRALSRPGLRRALVAETHARQRAERERLQEMKRRIEMEAVVAELQREREELIQLLAAPPPATSSPVLLPSSPCTSSRTIPTLGFPMSTS